MSKTITNRSEIPDAPYYVLSNDTFMSGWGLAEGKINTIILPCVNWIEAQQVAEYAKSRTDQRYVRIVTQKPRLRLNTHLYSLMLPDEATAWYKRRGTYKNNMPTNKPISTIDLEIDLCHVLGSAEYNKIMQKEPMFSYPTTLKYLWEKYVHPKIK